MTSNALLWIGVLCGVWLIGGYYFLFVRKVKLTGFIPAGLTTRDDSEVIVSKTKIMVKIVFAEEERVEATPEVFADFVVSFKEIINGTYKYTSPNYTTELMPKHDINHEIKNEDIGSDSEDKHEEDETDWLPDADLPDLSDSDLPEPPEEYTEDLREREKVNGEVHEGKLVDPNALNLNMFNQ